MRMVDIRGCSHQPECATDEQSCYFDEKPGLEARRDKPTGHNNMIHADARNLLHEKGRFAFNINDTNFEPRFHQCGSLTHDSSIGACRSQDMHTYLDG